MTLQEIQMELNDIEKRKGLAGIDGMLGQGNMMPFNSMNSGSRKIMHSVQVQHILPLFNPEPALIQTGTETLYGEYNSSYIKVDHDYDLICKIPKFLEKPDHHYYAIIRKSGTNEYDVIERVSYVHVTEAYGHLLNNKTIDSVRPGNDVIKAGTVLQKSTSFDDFDNRQDGVNLLTTYISCEKNKEDGIIISKSAAQKLASPLIKKISIQINDNDIPINLYGDNAVYKCIPDINEEIKDGILLASRREKAEEILFTQTYDRLSNIMLSDNKYRATGKVVDISVYCNNIEILDNNYYYSQLKYYNDLNLTFCNSVVDNLQSVVEDKRNKVSYELQKLYYNSKKIAEGGQYIKDRVYSNIMLEIVLIENSIAGKGDKLANRYGGKGVISEVRPDEMMPMLSDGTYVELIFNSSTCINRENLGQQIEMSLTFSAINILMLMRQKFLDIDECLELYTKFIGLVVPTQYNYIKNYIDKLDFDEKCMFLDTIVSDNGIYLSILPMSEIVNVDTINNIYKTFPFIDQFELTVPIKDSMGDIRYAKSRRSLTVGKQYIYRLKQYAEEKFSATSLSSTNIKNENSRSNAKKTYKVMHNRTPIRFGDMETGNMGHLGMDLVVMVLLLYSASPHARRLSEELLTGNPFNVDITLDENSTNRSVEILNAYLKTIGLKLVFIKKPKKKIVAARFERNSRIEPTKVLLANFIQNSKGSVNLPSYYQNIMNNPCKESLAMFKMATFDVPGKAINLARFKERNDNNE